MPNNDPAFIVYCNNPSHPSWRQGPMPYPAAMTAARDHDTNYHNGVRNAVVTSVGILNKEQWIATVKHPDAQFITTEDQWHKSFEELGDYHPLAQVEKSAVEEFSKSLKFGENGIAHANYACIEELVNYKRFCHLWSLFGLSPRLFAEYKDYRCHGHECTYDPGFICNTSSCN